MTQRLIAFHLSKSVPSDNYGFLRGLFQFPHLVSFTSTSVPATNEVTCQ